MARTSKSRGAKSFTMRSGNKSTFKMMGSSSPVRNDKVKRQTYSKAIDSVKADMTNQELRDIVVNQHKVDGVAKSSKWNVSYNELIRKRRSLKESVNPSTKVKETTTSSVKPDTKSTETTSDSDELTGYTISNEDREAIFAKHGGGVLTGAALEARERDLEIAASRYRR